MLISLVIPVYNEVESLEPLLAEIVEVATTHSYRLQVVLVDDGSRDGSWTVIQKLAAKYPADAATQTNGHGPAPGVTVEGVRFRRNFGKAAALSAGARVAKGELVMTLDADLQDDPHELPRFLTALDSEHDVISGYKQTRHDPWHKVYPSRVFNWMVSSLTGVKLHDHNCGMKLYRREVFSEVRLYGELHRFVPVLAAAKGFRVGEIVIQHRARKFGHSKYGVKRIVKGFLDLLTVKFLTDYTYRPQHILGTFGLIFFCLGGLGMAYLAVYWLWVMSLGGDPELHKRPLLLYSVALLLLGGQVLSIGLLAELITAQSGRDTESYSISERTTPAAKAEAPHDVAH